MKRTKRIVGFDFARAFAILGMMLVNYKIVFTYGVEKNIIISKFISIFEGRAAAVFLIIAGIGISLMTKKGFLNNSIETRKKDQITLIKRAVFLFVFGMILYGVFEWSADILHYYGVYMVLICIFLYMRPKNILFAIFSILLISFVLQIALDYTIGWNASFTEYYNFFTLKGFSRHLFFNGYHPVFPWFAFILIGLLVGRLDFNKRNSKRLLIIGISSALSIEVLSHYIIKLYNNSELMIYFFDTKPMNPTILYILAATGWALAFIGLCILLTKKYSDSIIIGTIASTGKMALTHYIMHAVGVLSLFFIIDEISYRDEVFVLVLSMIVFGFMITFSNLWLKHFKRGPFEMLMRKLS